jgi:glycosyltransferase involved in cell wall biosynthesis
VLPVFNVMSILSVAIPSYKRPDLLRRNLLVLAPQCHANNVSINIFDDSCSDVNQLVYDQITAQWPCLEIHKNAKNLGIDRNIDQCISVPLSDYVWMIGEDDLASEGAIAAILERLQTRPTYLFVNYQYISNDYAKFLHVAVNDLGAESLTAGEFFSRHGWATGFLGANVVNRLHWDVESTDYMGTYFNHVGKIFSQLKTSDTVEAIAQPLVYNRAESLDSFSWLNDCFEVYAGFGEMIERLVQRHPDWEPHARVCLANFTDIMTIRDLKSVLVLRALGVYSLEKYQRHMSMLRLWPAYLLVAVTPVALLKPLYRAYRALKPRLAAR